MATMGAGRGDSRGFHDSGGFGCRGGFVAYKHRNDDEACGSGLHPPLSDMHREAARKSHNAYAGDCTNFRHLGDMFDPTLRRRSDAELAWFAVMEVVAT
ncbi:hypothetical protein ZWY2020_047074 [Hordeum vulgare]|nr:hypothetical protein ZWY2020_047074 [Hordeum vulgare]